MNTMTDSPQESPQSRYAWLRIALEKFGKPPSALTTEQAQQTLQQVNRELAIGKRLLQAEEARGVVVAESAIEQAVAALASRYGDEAAFTQALEANALDRQSLQQALHHELKVEAVLERILAGRATISEAETEIYYLQHLERFTLPETRTARHILITINGEYAENRREQAEQRIGKLHRQLRQEPAAFGNLAQRHSECPSAMQEGLLGRVKPGQLYPELDARLFAMAEGEISEVVESPVGLHLLCCEQVHPAERRRFPEVRDRLRQHLETIKRKRLLREWLQG